MTDRVKLQCVFHVAPHINGPCLKSHVLDVVIVQS